MSCKSCQKSLHAKVIRGHMLSYCSLDLSLDTQKTKITLKSPWNDNIFGILASDDIKIFKELNHNHHEMITSLQYYNNLFYLMTSSSSKSKVANLDGFVYLTHLMNIWGELSTRVANLEEWFKLIRPQLILLPLAGKQNK